MVQDKHPCLFSLASFVEERTFIMTLIGQFVIFPVYIQGWLCNVVLLHFLLSFSIAFSIAAYYFFYNGIYTYLCIIDLLDIGSGPRALCCNVVHMSPGTVSCV